MVYQPRGLKPLGSFFVLTLACWMPNLLAELAKPRTRWLYGAANIVPAKALALYLLCTTPAAPLSSFACSSPQGLRPPPASLCSAPRRGLRGWYQWRSQSLAHAGYMARQTSCQSKPWHAACCRASPAKKRSSQSLAHAGYMVRQMSCQPKRCHSICCRTTPAKTYRLCSPSLAAIRGL
jgi:hypothetical protein